MTSYYTATIYEGDDLEGDLSDPIDNDCVEHNPENPFSGSIEPNVDQELICFVTQGRLGTLSCRIRWFEPTPDWETLHVRS